MTQMDPACSSTFNDFKRESANTSMTTRRKEEEQSRGLSSKVEPSSGDSLLLGGRRYAPVEEGPVGGPYDCQTLNGLDGNVLVDELRPASVVHSVEVSHEHEVP